jgi:hypothetical protein
MVSGSPSRTAVATAADGRKTEESEPITRFISIIRSTVLTVQMLSACFFTAVNPKTTVAKKITRAKKTLERLVASIFVSIPGI